MKNLVQKLFSKEVNFKKRLGILLFLLGSFVLQTTQAQDIAGPAGSGNFGNSVIVLSNGNFVVVDNSYDEGATVDVGAVYLYDGVSKALISTLKGSTANDQVGSGGIVVLSNGNFVVRSGLWNGSRGAVTWCSGTTGTSGVVSAANSLVGSTANDQVGGTGTDGVMPLGNGNYVVVSNLWDNGAVVDAGAVTWANGSTGIVGTVSAANSLVGSTTNDNVGSSGVTALTNGNYVVRSSLWNGSRGAVTWVSGTAGIVGAVSAANSLVGSTAGDGVGDRYVGLTNGNYVVGTQNWDNGAVVDVGAVTWANGTTGIVGAVSAANSLVGSTANDRLSFNGIVALTNGNYVVMSQTWNGDRGAVTWGNGSTGIVGAVSAANSLVGSTAGDEVGNNAVTALTNGNYVVGSPSWDSHKGAVTWGNGSTGIVGAVSAANSLVGSTAGTIATGDRVGGSGVTALTNGNYVVRSPNWNGVRGAATWGNGSTGIVGAVSAANSLVGSTTNDNVGSSGVTALTNGNYVVRSNTWDNGAVVDAGAATWGSGTAGISGAVSAANSLVGSTASDNVGNGVTALTNGNYVVFQINWDNGAVANVGAVTWANGSTGISGAVSAANSLIGSTVTDQVGTGVVALTNGNYVIRSINWDNGAVANVGAVTWANGSTGMVGVVSAANSLIGSTATDNVGSVVTALSNGNYVVRSNNWDNGALVNARAVSLADGSTGLTGTINNTNSVLGTVASGVSGFVYNSTRDYIIVQRPLSNMVTIFALSAPQIALKQAATVIPNSTGTHNFGNINVSANSGDITFTVENTGTASLNLSNFQINGTDAAMFTTTTFVANTVNAAGNTTFTIKFTPSSAGAKTAFITIGNNSTVNPYTFTVNGTGIAATQPFISVKQAATVIPNSTGTHNFGNINVSANSGDITFTVENTGTAALNLTSFQINGTDAAMFTSVNFVTTTINASANTTFTLKFTPTSAGAKTAFITIGNNSTVNPYTFTVNGTGIAATQPFISVKQAATVIPNSTGTHNFGNINVSANSGDITFTVENTGTAALNLTSFQINGADAAMFTSVNFVTTTINASANTTFTLKFTPTSAGAKTAFITIGNNSTVNPYTFTVNGTGVASPLIAVRQGANAVNHTGLHNFGNVNVNSNSGNITFTIENAGTATLNLGTFQLNGTNAGEFSQIIPLTNAVVAAGNTTFTLKFSPTSAGAKTAFITINSDATPNAYTFTLQGTGTALTTVTTTPNNPTTPNTGTTNTIVNTTPAEILTINGQNINIAPAGGSTTFVTVSPLFFASQLDFKLPSGFTLIPFVASQATISNGKITLNAVGQTKLTVIKADGTFSQIILNVEKANSFITIGSNMAGFANNLTCQSPAFALPLASNSPEKINLTVIAGKAEIQNNLIKVLGTGLVKIRATQAENNNFTSAQSFDFDFNVNKTSRTFSLANLTSKTFGDVDFVLPSDWNNEKLTYSSEAKNISISGNTVKILGAGQAVIKAFLAENDCYFASTFDLVLNVNKASQTINFAKIPDQRIGNANVILNANASSNLPITFQVIEGQNLVSLQGNSLKINGIGKVKVLAIQAGNENYLPTQAETIFEIFNEASIRITNTNLANKNENLLIDFVTTGIFSENNDFTVFLSNPNGIFEGFVQQISLRGNNGGRIILAIPSQILKSGNYRIQIRSTNPNVLSNTFNVPRVITPKPRTPVLTRVALVICAETNVSGKFQWFANGKLLPNETNRCLTISLSHFGRAEANQTITYTVIVADEEGRESELSSPFEIKSDQINLITGIESDLEQNPIRVYPNPTRDRLVLDLTSKSLRKIEISIFNMLGQKVLEKSLTNSQKEEVLDLQYLPSGTYLLEILSEKGKHRQQIVKE